jgi:hypothetical protein
MVIRKSCWDNGMWIGTNGPVIIAHFQEEYSRWAGLEGEDLRPFVPTVASVLRLVGGAASAISQVHRGIVNDIVTDLSLRFFDVPPLFEAIFGYLTDLTPGFFGEVFPIFASSLSFVYCDAFVPTSRPYQRVLARFAGFAASLKSTLATDFADCVAQAMLPYGLPLDALPPFFDGVSSEPFYATVTLFFALWIHRGDCGTI